MLGYDLAKLCFEGPAEELDSTVCSQPALFVTSLAALESLRRESPDVVLGCEAAAGLSLGEYTAMVFAGVMEFEDGLTLVQQRGEAMQEASDATPSGMVSILGLERDRGRGALRAGPQRAKSCRSPTCSARAISSISGTNAACERAAEAGPGRRGDEGRAAGRGRGVPHARSCSPADRASGRGPGRRAACAGREIPVVSNVDARPHDDPEEIRQLLVRQVVSPVRWEDSMRLLLDRRVSTSSTRSARAGCCGACCGGSTARFPAQKCGCRRGLELRNESTMTESIQPHALRRSVRPGGPRDRGRAGSGPGHRHRSWRRSGAKVACVDINAETLAETRRAIIRTAGGTAEPFACDVTDSERVDEVVDEVVEKWGGWTSW